VALVEQGSVLALWKSRRIGARPAGAGKALRVAFPAGLLKPRIYALRVSGIKSTGTAEIVTDYPFKVVK
jgi:hypothetical protein